MGSGDYSEKNRNYSGRKAGEYEFRPRDGKNLNEEEKSDLRIILSSEGFVESLEKAVDDFNNGRGTVRAAGEMPDNKRF